MNKLITKKWWLAAGTRAIKTFCQTAIGVIGCSYLISDVSWTVCLSASVLASVLSLLTSLAGLPEVEEGDTD